MRIGLVDPDNRRPVDFSMREQAMSAVARDLENKQARRDVLTSLVEDWADGQVKLAAMAILLAMRRDDPDFFLQGDYRPLTLEGPQAVGRSAIRAHSRAEVWPSSWLASRLTARASRTGKPAFKCPKAIGGASSTASLSTPRRY